MSNDESSAVTLAFVVIMLIAGLGFLVDYAVGVEEPVSLSTTVTGV